MSKLKLFRVNRTWRCSICHKVFDTTTELHKHSFSHELDTRNETYPVPHSLPVNVERKYCKTECNRAFFHPNYKDSKGKRAVYYLCCKYCAYRDACSGKCSIRGGQVPEECPVRVSLADLVPILI